MGADLLFAVTEMKLTKQQAKAKAARLCQPENIHQVMDALSNAGIVNVDYDIDFDAHAYLDECIETVYGSENSRTCGWFRVDDERLFYLTAGLSWGDTPTEEYDAFVVCQDLKLTV